MEDWKELDIYNLPRDLFVGSYEIQYISSGHWQNSTTWSTDNIQILKNIKAKGMLYRYRKEQPKPPTHEEIWTKAWKVWDGSWVHVYTYFPETHEYGILIKDQPDQGNHASFRSYVKREYFTGLESADIPPED